MDTERHGATSLFCSTLFLSAGRSCIYSRKQGVKVLDGPMNLCNAPAVPHGRRRIDNDSLRAMRWRVPRVKATDIVSLRLVR